MINKVSIIGIGKLGLCMALSLEKAGFEVMGVDLDAKYVKDLNNKVFYSDEPLVSERLFLSEKFTATLSLEECVNFSDLVFVVVATPSLTNGRYDHSQVNKVVDEILSLGKPLKQKHLVINCTTMPQYCETLSKKLLNHNWTISYNPEFIAQGTIIENQEKPDMVLIGETSKTAGDILEFVYKKMTTNNPRVYRMSTTEAEICKLSLNCFLTTKIAYTNMIGDIVKKSGGNPQKVLDAIGEDTRVGHKLTRYGFGYGGPCFPRDNRAIGIYANDLGLRAEISKATDIENQMHLDFQVKEFLNSGKKQYRTKYVTYKPGSILLTESQQLLFCIKLANQGVDVTICERRVVIDELKDEYGGLFTYEVLDDNL